MGSSMNELAVKNLALDFLVEKPLATAADDSPYARWLTRNYDHARDMFTRSGTWNWATEFYKISVQAAGDDPLFRWSWSYALPSGWLRVIPPTYLGDRGGQPIPFEVIEDTTGTATGPRILCDITPTLYVRLVMQRTDMTMWDELAVEAFALTLAAKMAHRFTAKNNFRDSLRKDAAAARRLALEVDTLESVPEPLEQHDVVRTRFT